MGASTKVMQNTKEFHIIVDVERTVLETAVRMFYPQESENVIEESPRATGADPHITLIV